MCTGLLILFTTVTLLAGGCCEAGPRPVFREDFECSPDAVFDSESCTGKCLSLDPQGYSAGFSAADFPNAGAISFQYKGTNPRTMLNQILSLRSQANPKAVYRLYPDLNTGSFLENAICYDRFWGDPLDWHSCTITWDAEGAVFYHDGLPVTCKKASTAPRIIRIKIKMDEPFDILEFQPAKGVLIDDIKLFDTAITPDQARSLYSAVARKAKRRTLVLTPAKIESAMPEDKREDVKEEKWFANTLGIDHSVPAPWTPVAAGERRFECWNRVYEFEPLGLSSISSGRENILAGPASIFVTDAGGKRLVPKVATIRPASKFPDLAEYDGFAVMGDLEVRVRAAAEFDGFVKYTVNVKPNKKTVVSGLGVELPLKKAFAKYVNLFGSMASYYHSSFRNPDIKKGKDFWWRFEPYTWVGNEDKGVCLVVESEKNCRWADRSSVQGLTRGNRLVFNFINGKTLISPDEAGRGIDYEFAIQATPMKPVPEDYRNFRLIGAGDSNPQNALAELGVGCRNIVIPGVPWCWHRPWPSFIEVDNQIADMAGAVKKGLAQGSIKSGYVTPYMNFQKYGYETEGKPPEPYARYKDIWSLSPKMGEHWESSYGWDEVINYCTQSKTFGDFLISTFVDFMKAHPDVNGIYLDETFAWGCDSELHGCGWRTAKGSLLGKYPVFANRELRKRWHKVAHSIRKDFLLWSHDSAFTKPPQLAYSDLYSMGETLAYETGDPLDAVTLRELRTEYLGRQFGVPQFFLPEIIHTGQGGEKTTRCLATLLLLHDIQTWNLFANPLEIDKIWALMNDFGMDDATKFVPYWSDKPYAVSSDKDVLSSAYVNPNKVMLIVYNIALTTKEADLSLSRALVLASVHPSETQVALKRSGLLRISLDPRECAILVLRSTDTR